MAYHIYVDFRSAFDSVDRQSLWLLLRSKGIPEKILQLLKKVNIKLANSLDIAPLTILNSGTLQPRKWQLTGTISASRHNIRPNQPR